MKTLILAAALTLFALAARGEELTCESTLQALNTANIESQGQMDSMVTSLKQLQDVNKWESDELTLCGNTANDLYALVDLYQQALDAATVTNRRLKLKVKKMGKR